MVYRFASLAASGAASRSVRPRPSSITLVTALLNTVAALATFALVSLPRPAFADARTEAAAKALESKAMQEDYLATDFDKALEKLNQASSKCGERCAPNVRAQIKRDIGVVQMAKQNREAAVAAFTEALRADANVQLDPDTRTKEVDAAWAEAKKQASGGGAGAGGGGSGGAPSGDFAMSPAPETLVRTPLDVYGEYSGSEALAKVVLKYKAFGMPDWKTIEMKSMDKGWGAEIPCVDILAGNLLYYVQGFNANNDPVATSGDRNNPFRTVVKQTFNGEVPHFPGRDAPRQCADKGDCPPDFPGCNKPADNATTDSTESSDSSLKDEGQDCEEDNECKSGTCGKDKTCKGGSKSGKRKRFWLGVALAYDFVNIPSGQDVCLLGAASATPVPSSNGYYCTVNGQDFPSRSRASQQEDINILQGQSDRVAGGFAPGNFRVMASFDYAATSNIMVGARAGYVVNGYTGQAAVSEGKAFIPLILELRGTYVFGKEAIDKAGLAPYAMLAGGVSQYSANVGVSVISEGGSVYNPTTGTVTHPAGQPFGASAPTPCTAIQTTCTTNAQAWSMSGPGFVSLGAGIRYAFTPAIALLFGPRVNLAFGLNGILLSISPELGMQFGF